MWSRTWIRHRLTIPEVQSDLANRQHTCTLSEFLEAITRDMQSGYSLSLAFVHCAKRFPSVHWWAEPIAQHCLHGKSLANAITASDFHDLPADYSLATRTLSVASSGGFGVIHTLEKSASILREREHAQAERKAQISHIELSTSVLSWIPLLICFWVLTHQMSAQNFLLRSTAGVICLVSGITLNAFGRMWMHRISRQST